MDVRYVATKLTPANGVHKPRISHSEFLVRMTYLNGRKADIMAILSLYSDILQKFDTPCSDPATYLKRMVNKCPAKIGGYLTELHVLLKQIKMLEDSLDSSLQYTEQTYE